MGSTTHSLFNKYFSRDSVSSKASLGWEPGSFFGYGMTKKSDKSLSNHPSLKTSEGQRGRETTTTFLPSNRHNSALVAQPHSRRILPLICM